MCYSVKNSFSSKLSIYLLVVFNGLPHVSLATKGRVHNIHLKVKEVERSDLYLEKFQSSLGEKSLYIFLKICFLRSNLTHAKNQLEFNFLRQDLWKLTLGEYDEPFPD